MKKSIDLVIPVYNEQEDLPACIEKLTAFFEIQDIHNMTIIIADNASIDNTSVIGKELAKKYFNVQYVYLPQKGRGGALRKVWLTGQGNFKMYCDVDLSADIDSIPQFIQALEDGADIVIGSRYLPDSKVIRGLKRSILSIGYNYLLRFLFPIKFKDSQCGMKAIKKEVFEKLEPSIKDNHWFFDTELLIRASYLGYIIKEIPVKWIEDLDSRVNIIETIVGYIKNILRMKKEFFFSHKSI